MASGSRTRFRTACVRLLRASTLLLIFLLPYAQLSWWPFPASTLALIGCFAWRWRSGCARRIGLPVSGRSITLTFVVASALWLLFRFALMPAIASSAGLRVEPRHPLAISEFAFQAFNEEVVLGYLPLAWLVRRWGRPVSMAVALAVVFAVLHFVLYRYGALGVSLAPLTLLALALVGVTRHGLILLAGHVGQSWALHAAWNLVMFSGSWRHEPDGRLLSEPELLDALLGSHSTSALLVCIAAATMLALRRGSRQALLA